MADFGTYARLMPMMLWGIAMAAIPASAQVPMHGSHAAKQQRERIAFSGALPALDGAHLKATLVEVTYGPGESSHPHSHPCPVIGYVIAGAVRMQVKGEAEVIYKAGESFYEAPHGVHEVSANASATEPATFLAYLVCDHEGPLSTPVAEGKGERQ